MKAEWGGEKERKRDRDREREWEVFEHTASFAQTTSPLLSSQPVGSQEGGGLDVGWGLLTI